MYHLMYHLMSRLLPQVTLLSQGRLMYHGPQHGLVAWFSGHLGHPYDAARDGIASDWAMDLISVGFGGREDSGDNGGGGGDVAVRLLGVEGGSYL